MKNIIIAWIKKYLLRIKSSSGILTGYEYEYDYLTAKKAESEEVKDGGT